MVLLPVALLVAAAVAALVSVRRSTIRITTQGVEVPTGKDGLIAFLNILSHPDGVVAVCGTERLAGG